MDWMLENPGGALRDCAVYFGYTQAWVSTVIHSDIFQAKLRERRGDIEAVVAADIPAKLRAVADIALEKLAAQLESSDNAGFIHETADMVLNRLGYGPKSSPGPVGGVNVQQNNFFVPREVLAELRGRIMEGSVEAGRSRELVCGRELVGSPAQGAASAVGSQRAVSTVGILPVPPE